MAHKFWVKVKGNTNRPSCFNLKHDAEIMDVVHSAYKEEGLGFPLCKVALTFQEKGELSRSDKVENYKTSHENPFILDYEEEGECVTRASAFSLLGWGWVASLHDLSFLY